VPLFSQRPLQRRPHKRTPNWLARSGASARSLLSASILLLIPLPRSFATPLAITSIVITAIVLTVAFGKDTNFDQLNYHFYVAHSLLNSRVTEDFFPANQQSYLNPLPYLPFYWMVKAGWPSMLIACVLASIHALAIILCFFIGRCLESSDI